MRKSILILSYICKKMGLSIDEMNALTIGQALDFMAEFVEANKPSKKKKYVRQATQADFDSF